jgi:hypothetical protein
LTGLQHAHFSNIEKRIISKFEQQYNMSSQASAKPKEATPDAQSYIFHEE